MVTVAGLHQFSGTEHEPTFSCQMQHFGELSFHFFRARTSGPPKWAKCVHMLSNAKRDADLKAILFPCTWMPKADTKSCPKLVQILRLANTNMRAWWNNRQLSWQGPAIVPGDQKCKGCAELQAEESTTFHRTIVHPLWCWHKFANSTTTPNRAQRGHRCCCCCYSSITNPFFRSTVQM